ncbi:hypothetical protein GJ496_011303 [Pomphorhynchus laevis]|nr:hypothetical protein GJ496_011303 [Pomphorhynchus laevis]
MEIRDPMACTSINFENPLAIAHQNMTDSAEINGITAQDDIIIKSKECVNVANNNATEEIWLVFDIKAI